MEVISKEETIIKSIYKTSDGQEFTREVDAEYHESIMWLKSAVIEESYKDKDIFIYKVTTEEDYKRFITALSHRFSWDFLKYQDTLKVSEGDVVVAWVEELCSDSPDWVYIMFLNSFLACEREKLQEQLATLNKLENKYRKVK